VFERGLATFSLHILAPILLNIATHASPLFVSSTLSIVLRILQRPLVFLLQPSVLFPLRVCLLWHFKLFFVIEKIQLIYV